MKTSLVIARKLTANFSYRVLGPSHQKKGILNVPSHNAGVHFDARSARFPSVVHRMTSCLNYQLLLGAFEALLPLKVCKTG